jgi:hypothetical protein
MVLQVLVTSIFDRTLQDTLSTLADFVPVREAQSH